MAGILNLVQTLFCRLLIMYNENFFPLTNYEMAVSFEKDWGLYKKVTF